MNVSPVPAPPARAATGGQPFRYSRLLALFLILLVSACRQAAPSLETATQTITPDGGTLSLPGGVAAAFEPGFLGGSAAITLGLSDAPPTYPLEAAADYGGGEAMARSATLTIPAAALAATGDLLEQPELAIRVPVTVPRLEGEERLLAEVHLHLADGQHLFFFEPYARVEGEMGQSFDGTDTVTIRAGQLRADKAARLGDVRVTVRPVRLSNRSLAPQALPSGFVLEDVVTNLSGVAFDFAADGRIFIAEKSGVVKVFQNGRVQSTPFANLSSQVNNITDRGLLGIAVHPQFPQQPYVYVLFTYDPPETEGGPGLNGFDDGGARVARLLRLTADAARNYNVAMTGSEVVLLGKNSTYANIGDPAARNSATPSCGPVGNYVQDCLPADELSHTIGTVRFGTDGSLFVGNGDGASWVGVKDYTVRALDVDSLAGKILRIDPLTGRGYSDNPFYNGDPNSNRSKVYNLGMRNPFRFTIDRRTNVPFIGDVGQGTWEEVNSGRGKNFGWPCYEGGNRTSLQQGAYRSLSRCASLYAKPDVTASLYAYNHGNGGSSVQMGDFYTGTRYPAAYRGSLFISDINQGWIRYLSMNADGTVAAVNEFATNQAGITQMSAGPQGDLYLMNMYANAVQRLRYTGPEETPLVAKLGADPLQGVAPLAVDFSSADSSGAGTLRYTWNFGNGETSTEANPSHTFTEPGVYKVTLNVTDDSGDSASASVSVRASNTPPVATILSPASGTRYTVGDPIAFGGRGTDAEQGELPENALRWTIKMHHNEHVHPDSLPPTTGASGSFIADDHGDNTYPELCLTATDAFGEEGTSCVALYPNTVAYTLDTQPTGLELPWEGKLRQTPFTVQTNVGASQQLIAPAQQGPHTFSGWSDGGAREHTIKVGSTSTRLVANYTQETARQNQTIQFISAAPTTAKVGGNYTVRATVSSGLAVSFRSANSKICTVSGSTVRFVAVGSCTVRASQAGNASYNAAPTVSQTFTIRAATVTKKNQSIRFTSSKPTTAKVGGRYTVRATVSSGLAVSFRSANSKICTVSGSTVRFVAAGSCTVRASQAGNASYNAAPTVSQTFRINRRN
jgi:glucose/arabinose dehydrogenase